MAQKGITLKAINKIYHDTYYDMKFNLQWREPRKGEEYLGADGTLHISGEGEVGTGNFRIVLDYKENK